MNSSAAPISRACATVVRRRLPKTGPFRPCRQELLTNLVDKRVGTPDERQTETHVATGHVTGHTGQQYGGGDLSGKSADREVCSRVVLISVFRQRHLRYKALG